MVKVDAFFVELQFFFISGSRTREGSMQPLSIMSIFWLPLMNPMKRAIFAFYGPFFGPNGPFRLFSHHILWPTVPALSIKKKSIKNWPKKYVFFSFCLIGNKLWCTCAREQSGHRLRCRISHSSQVLGAWYCLSLIAPASILTVWSLLAAASAAPGPRCWRRSSKSFTFCCAAVKQCY